ncbi:MAG: allantoate amidohydrolase [Planctomycetota bacterium]|nr:MAG: allantoate amidohydrolase [Planctomycetota bacterium]
MQRVRQAARRIMARCDELARCTDCAGEITRLFCSPAMESAHDLLRGWMQEAGLGCRMDAAGNFRGRHEPPSAGGEAARPLGVLLIGSHLDSVVNAGRYDGPLGVLLGLAVAELAAEAQARLPFALEVVGFCEEEGVRYQAPFFGSRALAGEGAGELLERVDAHGVTLADALRRFGGDPDRLADCACGDEEIVAYLEPHIEQGPVLEQHGVPLGIVTGAVGQTRASLQFVGRAGHAGTVPMCARRDALAGAAQFVLELEALARATDGLVATVGHLEMAPNVANVIPAAARLRIDLRHADDATRQSATSQAMLRAATIARERGLDFEVLWLEETGRVDFDGTCVDLLERSVVEAGWQPHKLASGAGHDAMVMAKRYPSAMLFLRCAGGTSHHPDECVSESDVCAALDVLWRFVEHLARRRVARGVPPVGSSS